MGWDSNQRLRPLGLLLVANFGGTSNILILMDWLNKDDYSLCR